MKNLLLAVLVLSAVAFAQNAPIPTQTWSTNFSAMSIPGGHTTFAGTVADVGVAVTPNFSAQFETVQSPGVPNFAGYYGGGVRYQINWVSKKLNEISPNLSGFRILVSALGSAGVESINGNHVGATLGGRVDYSLDSGGHYQPGIEVRAVRLPYVCTGWKPAVSLGIKFGF